MRHLLLLALLSTPLYAQDTPISSPAVRFETSLGNFVVLLDEQRAPLSCANFLRYVADGHYAGTLMHRVVAGFVVQGGGFATDGSQKPTRAPIANESGNGLGNRRGSIAMARMGDPHSATSQFYVNLADNSNLDPQPGRWGYAVFGSVVQGMDVIDRIAGVETGSRPLIGDDVPLQPVVILKAERILAVVTPD